MQICSLQESGPSQLFFPVKLHLPGYALGGGRFSWWVSKCYGAYLQLASVLSTKKTFRQGAVLGDIHPSCSLCPGQGGLPLCSPGKVEDVPVVSVSISRAHRWGGVTAAVVFPTLWRPVLSAHRSLQDGAGPHCPLKGRPSQGAHIVTLQAKV